MWITVHLADYLRPRGSRPYEDLAPDLERLLKRGNRVMLLSVPGFCMLTGHPGAKTPWLAGGKWYKTAKRALKGH